jgi:hypothetical protein
MPFTPSLPNRARVHQIRRHLAPALYPGPCNSGLPQDALLGLSVVRVWRSWCRGLYRQTGSSRQRYWAVWFLALLVWVFM